MSGHRAFGPAVWTACAALVTAQPAMASRNLEGLVLQTFMARCLTPMQTGAPPDVSGLTPPEGNAEPSAPGGAEQRFSNVDGPMSLRIQTAPEGDTSCALSVEMSEGFDTQQIRAALAARLSKAGFNEVQTCLSDTFGQHGIFQRDAQPGGNSRLGVTSAVVRSGAELPDQFSLIAAEYDSPQAPALRCTEDEEDKP